MLPCVRRDADAVGALPMGPWTYYSPLWIGLLLVAVMSDSIFEWDLVATAPAWVKLAALCGVGVAVALALQLGLIGAQGAFAQVLPAPAGRSIRGPAAVFVGWSILSSITLLAAAFLFSNEELAQVWRVVGGIGGACGLMAAVAYVWSWPVAQQDFSR